MQLSDFQSKLPFRVTTGTDYAYREFLNGTYELDFNVYLPSIDRNLQRPFIWKHAQKESLIESIFMERSIPPVALIVHEHSRFQVIDGKQRLSSVMSFCRNEWMFHGYLFRDLPSDMRSYLERQYFRAAVAYEYDNAPISDSDKIEWFRRLNFAGTPQDIDHLTNLTSI